MLNRLLADERFSPNRALLAEMLALYFDVVKEEDRELMRTLLLSTFGDYRHINWRDKEDPPSEETHLARLDGAYTKQVREIYSSILKEKQDDASNRSTS